jgi:hypothetical protein
MFFIKRGKRRKELAASGSCQCKEREALPGHSGFDPRRLRYFRVQCTEMRRKYFPVKKEEEEEKSFSRSRHIYIGAITNAESSFSRFLLPTAEDSSFSFLLPTAKDSRLLFYSIRLIEMILSIPHLLLKRQMMQDLVLRMVILPASAVSA